MIEVCAKHPPLSYRTSPPQGGRFAVTNGFPNRLRCRTGRTDKLLISPLAGEMSGRTEGGVTDRGLASIDPIAAVAP
ncbi:hypothetical protein Mesop_0152 [Mesorhizobium opportunistum WSM2075]|uniref:Propionyl-coenzyme A carboxylase alpha polypeptide n=1 Tax=Mesorhizobium opportunistum (strain LMG 24607 / HAMBI 3007 / WSM2075) TaxID=536019 RepID=F7YGK1_MESOW|nr:hypothetical protein Mesop_0152 [Mesorhizobium opportunistum WSM2075]